jgi:hypothetical protein
METHWVHLTGGIRNLPWWTCLLCQGVGDDEVVAIVGRTRAHLVSYICGSGRAWLVLQALVVGLDLVPIDAHLNLRGEGDVQTGECRERLLQGAKQQQSQRRVCPEASAYGVAKDEIACAVLAMAWRGCIRSVVLPS